MNPLTLAQCALWALLESGREPLDFSTVCSVYLGICDWQFVFTYLDEVMRLAKCNTDYFLWSDCPGPVSQSVSVRTWDKSHTNCHDDVMSLCVMSPNKIFHCSSSMFIYKDITWWGNHGRRVQGNFLDMFFTEASEFCLWKMLHNANGLQL